MQKRNSVSAAKACRTRFRVRASLRCADAVSLLHSSLGVQGMNAEEKQRQRSEGLHGLENVYGTDVGAQLKEQGLVPEDINAMLKANESGWGKNLMDWTKTLTGAAGGAASLKTAFG